MALVLLVLVEVVVEEEEVVVVVVAAAAAVCNHFKTVKSKTLNVFSSALTVPSVDLGGVGGETGAAM